MVAYNAKHHRILPRPKNEPQPSPEAAAAKLAAYRELERAMLSELTEALKKRRLQKQKAANESGKGKKPKAGKKARTDPA